MTRSLSIPLTDTARLGDARREAALMAGSFEMSDTELGRVSLIVTEAGQNLQKHARGGQILLRSLADDGLPGIEIMTVDRGPGMTDVSKCLEDGYSTAGSPGTGLGAISRLSNVFDIYSEPQKGTVLVSRLWRKTTSRPGPMELGAVCLPKEERDACGDVWSVRHGAGYTDLLVADGLGHGLLAARAADQAARIFEESAEAPAATVSNLHLALRSTRGASLAIARVDYRDEAVRYCGVGNISGVIAEGLMTRSMVSHNGTVGHEVHVVKEFCYPWCAQASLILHSDGLQTRWKLENHPGLVTRHPSIIAGVLYRDYMRGRDDVTVLVARERESSPVQVKAEGTGRRN